MLLRLGSLLISLYILSIYFNMCSKSIIRDVVICPRTKNIIIKCRTLNLTHKVIEKYQMKYKNHRLHSRVPLKIRLVISFPLFEALTGDSCLPTTF
jgi:hypothetical protein